MNDAFKVHRISFLTSITKNTDDVIKRSPRRSPKVNASV